MYHALNIVWIFSLDYFLYTVFGSGALKYLVASTMIAGSGFHPCAAHFLAEHYVFSGQYETYSYYGWLNWFCFNVGYLFYLIVFPATTMSTMISQTFHGQTSQPSKLSLLNTMTLFPTTSPGPLSRGNSSLTHYTVSETG